ncbi:MAG: response regulator transcription factor [Patescibacteria group bacterium]
MKLLIVEDEVKLAETLKRGLEQNGYAVDVVHDGQEGLDQIEISYVDYDLVVLDIMLPHRNGFDICQTIRGQGITIPIIMLTARDSLSDKVMGLDAGADDYVIKPFAFQELLARVKSLLRRPRDVCITKLKYGELSLDPSSRTVFNDDKSVKLTAKEFAILEYLMRNAGKVISREMILSHVWDQAFDSFSNVVDVHIANLKKKIDKPKYETFIEAVRGSGYRFRK